MTIEDPLLSASGYQLLSLATSYFVVITIEDPSLSDHGYQLLSTATSYLVGNNRKFDVSHIFWGVLFIVDGD